MKQYLISKITGPKGHTHRYERVAQESLKLELRFKSYEGLKLADLR
jgi:hypothetical protein